MKNNFGNFAVQKMLKYGTPGIQADIFEILRPNIHGLSVQEFGCRVVQMSIEIFKNDEKRLD